MDMKGLLFHFSILFPFVIPHQFTFFRSISSSFFLFLLLALIPFPLPFLMQQKVVTTFKRRNERALDNHIPFSSFCAFRLPWRSAASSSYPFCLCLSAPFVAFFCLFHLRIRFQLHLPLRLKNRTGLGKKWISVTCKIECETQLPSQQSVHPQGDF